MGFGSEDSRAVEPRVCQEQGAIAVPGKNVQLVSMPRVKVFRLKDDGGWDDCGTGHVTIDYLKGSTSAHDIALAVIDEENNETMLLHQIISVEIYRKEDVFITWFDPDAGMTLCLSFQDAAGCSNVWDVMCQVRREQEPHLLCANDTNGSW